MQVADRKLLTKLNEVLSARRGMPFLVAFSPNKYSVEMDRGVKWASWNCNHVKLVNNGL